MCPGTVAGEFDASQHRFVNQDYGFIREALVETVHMMRLLNPSLRFLFTVSPVPLTATMSGRHVLVATMESKSILRAVAGSVARELEFADYFPSYEIINATPFRGTFFEANQRNVNHAGVAHVMSQFFACLNAKFPVVDERDESSAVSSEVAADIARVSVTATELAGDGDAVRNSAADIAGIRAVLVHAKDDDARRFYEYFDFDPSPSDSYHLYLLIKDLRKAAN